MNDDKSKCKNIEVVNGEIKKLDSAAVIKNERTMVPLRFVSEELGRAVEYVPSTYTALTNPDDIKNMAKMLEMFEDNDDVQAVWHNWEMPEE